MIRATDATNNLASELKQQTESKSEKRVEQPRIRIWKERAKPLSSNTIVLMIQFLKDERDDISFCEGLYVGALEEKGAGEGPLIQFMAMTSVINEVQESVPILSN